MSDQPVEGKAVDPLEQWRDLRDVYMDAWAKAMGETVNSEAYTQASGAVLETYLTASTPFRDAQKKAMISALEQLNMPSRAEFVSLAERLANIELLLDDMSAKLDEVHQLATKAAAPAKPEAKSETMRSAQPNSEAKSEAVRAAAQPIFAAQPISVAKPVLEAKPVSEAKHVSEAKAVPEAKSETKPAAHKAAKSAKKGSK